MPSGSALPHAFFVPCFVAPRRLGDWQRLVWHIGMTCRSGSLEVTGLHMPAVDRLLPCEALAVKKCWQLHQGICLKASVLARCFQPQPGLVLPAPFSRPRQACVLRQVRLNLVLWMRKQAWPWTVMRPFRRSGPLHLSRLVTVIWRMLLSASPAAMVVHRRGRMPRGHRHPKKISSRGQIQPAPEVLPGTKPRRETGRTCPMRCQL